MNNLPRQRESNSSAPHKPASVGLTPTVATISKPAQIQVRDDLAGVTFRPKVQNRVINGPANSGSGRQWFSIKNEADADAAEIFIFDQIGKNWFGEGTDANSFRDEYSKIPKTKNIALKINSPGGNVFDGFAIFNMLAEHKGRVDTFNMGLAASIASVLLLAARNGGKVHAANVSQTMIHDPSTYAEGTVADMERAKNALQSAKDSIIVAYVAKTGKTKEELSDLMTDETWMTGDKAKEMGFVDVVTQDNPISNSFDISNFKRVPEAFRKLQNSAAQNDGGQKSVLMRNKIIARLKKMGIQFDANATDEQLIALLDDAIEAQSKQTTTPPPAPAPTPAPTPSAVDNAAIAIMQAQLKEMKELRDKERRANVTARVDALIAERRVTAAERDFLIENGIADERHLTNAAARPQILPPEGVNVVITSEAPSDILNGLKARRAPINAMLRGEDPDEAAILRNAAENYRDIQANIAKIRPFIIQNAHSVDAALQQNVIMAEGMRAFKRRILALNAFSTVFNNVALKGSDKVEVPYQALYSTASTDFVQANGYVMAEDGAISKKEVTINARKYQPFQFNSAYWNRQPYFNIQTLFMQRAEQLGVDVVNTVLANVTLANFGAASFTGAASTFDKDDMIDLKVIADNAYWPLVGRSVMLKHEYEGALLKSIVGLTSISGEEALRRGVTGRIADFDVFGNAGIPANAQNLVGFICIPSALIVATSPVLPAPGVIKNLVKYDVVIDPDSGAAFEYRYWGNPDKDEDREVVECNFGHAVGEAAALKRLVSA